MRCVSFNLIPVIFLFPVLITGCYAYKVYPKNYRDYHVEPTDTVYVVNTGLDKEYSILKNSGIYIITNDSTNKHKVKLYPLKKKLSCGQPMLGTLITLGQLPVYFPDRYFYSYDDEQGGKTTSFEYELRIARRTWFWDLFTQQKNFNKKAGQALGGSHYLKGENITTAR